MKMMTKIISVVMIFTISILFLLFLDFNEASIYLKLRNFDREMMSIKYDSNNENLVDVVKEIQLISRKHNVILAKTNVDSTKENAVNVYLSVENINDLIELLKKNFKIEVFNNKKNDTSFISTYNQNDENQIAIINDLFGNHFYTYYLMDQMVEKDDSLFGNYFVFYTDFQDYSNFVNEINELLGYDTYSSIFSNNIQNYIIILMFGSLLFLMLFYFIFQVYEYYNNSKKIGCMRLLGFDMMKINQNMIRSNILIYFISFLIMIVLTIFFVKNILLSHLLLLILINLFIVLLTCFISYISCIIINKTYQTTSILKMKNITLKISKVSYKFKSLMTIMLICFSVIAFESVSGLCDELKIYEQSKNLLDYGVFQSYVVNQSESYNYDEQYDFYLNIVNNVDTIYAEFHDYSQYTNEDFNNIQKAAEDGTSFIYDSVDKNYLKIEKIKVYNLQGEEVDVETFDSVCFLFPKSKQHLITLFKNFHEEIDDYYRQFNSEYVFKSYLYDDQKLDTYQVNLKYVESPILRVIDDSIKYPSFYDGLGISFFGEGLRTGLKIKLIDDDKEKTMQVLNEYLEKSNLSNLFSEKSFITYKDYFNDEILMSKLILLFLSLIIVMIFTVYVLISFQLVKLYIKSQKKKVLVKKLLGFDNDVIFEQIYSKNLNNTLISIVISLVVLIIIKKINISYIIMISIFLILDYLVTFLSIRTTDLSAIYLELKGGYHD